MIHLKIQNLSFFHLGPFNLEVQKTEIVGLDGPSGAGKTLLLRAVADLDPHDGNIFLDGISSEEMSAHVWRKKIGLLPAESRWWRDTVGEHFFDAKDGWLNIIGFEKDVFGWQINRLSSGERQRLALLRILMNEPDVLLLDEPTANLDQDNTQKVEKLLELYQDKTKASILWVTHSGDQIKRIATRHFRLDKGQLTEVKIV